LEFDQIMTMAKQLQDDVREQLTERLNDMRDFFLSAEDCDGKPFAETQEKKQEARMSNKIWRFYAEPAKAVAGVVGRSAKYVGIKAVSAGFAIASWIGKNPATAKMILFTVIQIKKEACRWIGSQLRSEPKKFEAGLEGGLLAVAKQVDDKAEILVSLLSKSLNKAIPGILKTTVLMLGATISGPMGSIWIIGGFAEKTTTAITGIFANCLEDSAVKLIQAQAWKKDYMAAVRNIFILVDLEECAIDIFGFTHPYTKAIQHLKTTFKLPIHKKKEKGNVEKAAEYAIGGAKQVSASFTSVMTTLGLY
jgi:hypothetical protein